MTISSLYSFQPYKMEYPQFIPFDDWYDPHNELEKQINEDYYDQERAMLMSSYQQKLEDEQKQHALTLAQTKRDFQHKLRELYIAHSQKQSIQITANEK